MNFAVVTPAERDGELVADFSSKRAALGKAEVVSVAGVPAADQARLLRDVTEVVAIADPSRHFNEVMVGASAGPARFQCPPTYLMVVSRRANKKRIS
jgi:hypothetical protein